MADVLSVRLTKEERRLVTEAAHRAGHRVVSSYVRTKLGLNAHAVWTEAEDVVTPEFTTMISLLDRVAEMDMEVRLAHRLIRRMARHLGMPKETTKPKVDEASFLGSGFEPVGLDEVAVKKPARPERQVPDEFVA